MLSIITWAPFVGAVLIMFLARHRPLAVRLIALVTTGISTVLSIAIFVAYDREAAGFQFYEKIPLVPPLGISYELAVDGMSLLMVLLLTSDHLRRRLRLVDGGSRAARSSTRSCCALVTGVYGVFVSLDLFVFFLFYELAVLPMYLLIGIWGSSGEVRPRGIFGWAFRETGRGVEGVRGDEAHALPAVRLGVHPGRASSRSTWHGGRRRSRSSSSRPTSVDPRAAVLGLPRVLRRLRHPRRHLAACTPGRRTATPPPRPRSRCCTPAC